MPKGKSSLIVQERLVLNSPALGRSVEVDLYLPTSASAPAMNLLLINDGQDLVKMDLGDILDELYGRGLIAPLLCAGIHAGRHRKMEYGTAGCPDYRGRGALAGEYGAFVLDELLPRLRAHSAPQGFKGQAFAGFSLGALSAMDIVWNHPHEFNKAGLFSGSFWWRIKDKDDPDYRDDTDRIMHRQVREGVYHPGLKFFFECGTEDELEDRNHNGIIDSIDDTQDLIRELTGKGYDPGKDMHYLQIEGGGHDMATWARALPEFLKWGWGEGAGQKPGKG